MDLFSTNYNADATDDDGSCAFINTGVTHGITILGADVDGIELSTGSTIGVSMMEIITQQQRLDVWRIC